MSMDDVFKALADPVRRKLLDRLFKSDGQTLTELCDGLGMTRQGVSKHLAVLEAANLIVARKQGRERLHHLNPVPIQQVADRWIGKYQRSAIQALTDLKQKLEGDQND
jgi:DNA-binding transcriptional ArsR family regulator